MTYTLRINARNDLHLPLDLLRKLNIGDEKVMKAQIKDNQLILIPVDLEPRYSQDELDGLQRIHADEKKRGFHRLKSSRDIEDLPN